MPQELSGSANQDCPLKGVLNTRAWAGSLGLSARAGHGGTKNDDSNSIPASVVTRRIAPKTKPNAIRLPSACFHRLENIPRPGIDNPNRTLHAIGYNADQRNARGRNPIPW